MFGRNKTEMVDPDAALPGRADTMPVPPAHHVHGRTLGPDFPEGLETAIFGMGCFWGSEELFWAIPGVYSTAVGYSGGYTPNPTYEETCSGRTGHTEVVLVAYDPAEVDFEVLLKAFWENHDPTSGMRQGNDIGSQYRSAIYPTTDEQAAAVKASVDRFQEALDAKGYGQITTEVRPSSDAGFYYAEPYHQQYLSKNPHGYRCHANSGVEYVVPAAGA